MPVIRRGNALAEIWNKFEIFASEFRDILMCIVEKNCV